MSPAPAESFTRFGPSHLAMLGLFVLGAWLLARWGRAHAGAERSQRLRRGFALAILAFQLPMQVYSMLPAQWDLGGSLPFQLCDLAWMAAVYALWTLRAWAYALIYYWGLTLTTQALLTPDLRAAFPQPQFIMFWGMHLLVVWAAIYLTWGLGLRPDWRGYRRSVAFTAAWLAAMLAFNALAGTNYLYANAKPAGASLLNLLGPWPWYLASELALGAALWAAITWPWTRR